jgi:hypothetical protein
MTIMWGVSKNDDVWDGGKILDPKNGKVYKVKLSLKDGGQKPPGWRGSVPTMYFCRFAPGRTGRHRYRPEFT